MRQVAKYLYHSIVIVQKINIYCIMYIDKLYEVSPDTCCCYFLFSTNWPHIDHCCKIVLIRTHKKRVLMVFWAHFGISVDCCKIILICTHKKRVLMAFWAHFEISVHCCKIVLICTHMKRVPMAFSAHFEIWLHKIE